MWTLVLQKSGNRCQVVVVSQFWTKCDVNSGRLVIGVYKEVEIAEGLN